MTAPLQCLRCETPLKYFGVRYLHEGKQQVALNRLALDVYSCPQCGKVELFEDGVGDRLRNEEEIE